MLIKNKRLSKTQSPHKTSIIEGVEITRATELEIHKAKQEAKAIRQEAENVLIQSKKRLTEAETKANEIIQSANKKAEEIKDKVYRETLQLANKEADEIKIHAKSLLQELFQVKREALNQAHADIIKVALDLAEKIIKYQASVDPGILKTQVVESIKKATSEADRVQVFVNPGDLKTLQESISDIEKLFPTGIDIVPLSNNSVEPGSCIIETKSGQLDATFATQLKSLAGLVSHLEVKPPDIQFQEKPLTRNAPRTIEEPLFEESIEENVLDIQQEEPSLTQEEEELKKELLGNEPLIDLIDENGNFQFSSETKTQPVEEAIIIDEPKKKLFAENLLERTKEEAEELDDEEIEFDYEEDDEKETEETINLKSILKPKKSPPSSGIKNIASELEKNPEWKDLIQGEDEE